MNARRRADGLPARADATTTCRITFDCGGYSFTDPVWSPRGDWIAFSRQGGGKFVDRRHPDGRHGHCEFLPTAIRTRARPGRRTDA